MVTSEESSGQATNDGEGGNNNNNNNNNISSHTVPARLEELNTPNKPTFTPPPPPLDPYFRHLSFEATFGQVAHVFRERYPLFLAISFIVYVAGWMVALLAALAFGADLQIDGFSVTVRMQGSGGSDGYDENGQYYQEESTRKQAWQIFSYSVELAIYYCFICIAHGASVWLAAHLYLEQRPKLFDAFRQATKCLWALIGSLLLVMWMWLMPGMFGVLLAYAFPQLLPLAAVLLLVLALWLQILFYHTYPAIMVEGLGPVESLKRSYYLTQDHRCYILGVLVCWALIRLVVGILIGSIEYIGYPNSWVLYLGQSLDTVFGILFAAIESVFQAVLYLRNRVVKEHLNRGTLAANLGSDFLSADDENQNYVFMDSSSVSNKVEGGAVLDHDSTEKGNSNKGDTTTQSGIMA